MSFVRYRRIINVLYTQADFSACLRQWRKKMEEKTFKTEKEKLLTEEEKFAFYKAVRNSTKNYVKHGEHLMLNDFFGRFIREYPECSKSRLGINNYGQIYPSLEEFISFEGEGLKSFIKFSPVQRYEEMLGTPDNTTGEGYYVYVRIDRVHDEVIYCSSGRYDGIVFTFSSQENAAGYVCEPGRWIWGLCAENGASRHIIPCREEDSGFVGELRSFFRQHQVEDTVCLPVTNVFNDIFFVNIGPNAYVPIPSSSVDPALRESIRSGTVFLMRVIGLEEDGRGRMKVFLAFEKEIGPAGGSPVRRKKRIGMEPDSLDIGYLPMSDNTVAYIMEDNRIRDALIKHFGSLPDKDTLRTFVLEKYQEYHGTGMNLVSRRKGGAILISVPLDIRDDGGVPLDAYVNKNSGRDSFFLASICSTSPEDVIKRLLFTPDWDENIEDLSSMAMPEDWTGPFSRRNYILYNYILISFYKAYVDDGIFSEGEYAVFNTGLIDSQYNDIYGCMKKTRRQDGRTAPVWKFLFFAARGNGNNGKRLNKFFSRFPAPPQYVPPDKYSEMFFDTSKDLSIDYRHILVDNYERFPVKFIREALADNDVIASELESTGDICLLKKRILGDDECVQLLCLAFERCVRDSINKARWHYNLAVPIYYPRTNGLCLLLPLWLTADDRASGKASAALVVEHLQSGHYQGHTIYTPFMYAVDSRQLGKIEKSWL